MTRTDPIITHLGMNSKFSVLLILNIKLKSSGLKAIRLVT